jgi:hypothetical protein
VTRRAVLAAGLCLAACAQTARFEAPPDATLERVELLAHYERGVAIVTLRNRSPRPVQYLAPLFFCSPARDEIENAYPWDTYYVDGEGWMLFHERALVPGATAKIEWSAPICDEPTDRVGLFVKISRDGMPTYRVVWSAPVGAAPTRTHLRNPDRARRADSARWRGARAKTCPTTLRAKRNDASGLKTRARRREDF